MSGTDINDLLQIWAATLPQDQDPPVTSKNNMYSAINGFDLGGAPWNSFTVDTLVACIDTGACNFNNLPLINITEIMSI